MSQNQVYAENYYHSKYRMHNQKSIIRKKRKKRKSYKRTPEIEKKKKIEYG